MLDLRPGDVWEAGGKRLLVVKVGRGQARSAVVVWQEGQREQLLLEVDHHLARWSGRRVSRKPANRRWAKEYRDSHHLPDL